MPQNRVLYQNKFGSRPPFVRPAFPLDLPRGSTSAARTTLSRGKAATRKDWILYDRLHGDCRKRNRLNSLSESLVMSSSHAQYPMTFDELPISYPRLLLKSNPC